MSGLPRLLEHFGWALSAFFGFLSGVIGLLAGQIFDGYYWPVAIGVAAVCGIICLLVSSGERLFRRLFDGVFDWFDRLGTKTVAPRHLQDQGKELRYPSWIAFVVGVIVAFVAGLIFTPAEIMSVF